MDVQQRFEMKDILHVGKFDPKMVINAVHFDGLKGWTMVKRFHIETGKLREKYSYLTDHPKSKLLFASIKPNPRIKYTIKVKGKAMPGEISLGDFMDVKGWKAVGNKLSDSLLSSVKEIEATGKPAEPQAAEAEVLQGNLFGAPEPVEPAPVKDKGQGAKGKENEAKGKKAKADEKPKTTYKAGDTIEFD